MKKIKVSVVSPIYKVPEKLLRNNIEHLINQTLKEIEIILVDDGSPDECGKICDEYAFEDNRVHVIHQKNRGLCGARNTGQKAAKGEYLMFIDGDDCLEYNSLESMYAVVSERKYDVINACLIKDYGYKKIKFDYSDFKEKAYLNNECMFWQEKVLDFNANISTVNCKLYRLKFLNENNLLHKENLKQGAEGLEFLIRVFNYAKSVRHLEKFLYHYMYNDVSITENHNEENHRMVLNCFYEIENDIRNYNNYAQLKKCLNDRLQHVIITTAISGYFSPTNHENYFTAKKKYKEYLKDNLIKESLKNGERNKLSFSKRLTITLISLRMFVLVKIISTFRYIQKQKRKK